MHRIINSLPFVQVRICTEGVFPRSADAVGFGNRWCVFRVSGSPLQYQAEPELAQAGRPQAHSQSVLGPTDIGPCSRHALGSGGKAAGARGGAGLRLVGTVIVSVHGPLTACRPQGELSARETLPSPNSVTEGGSYHPVSQIRKRKDLARFGSQMFHLFQKQGAPSNSPQMSHEFTANTTRRTAFWGVLDFSSFRPLMRG